MAEKSTRKLWRVSWLVLAFFLLLMVGGGLLVANRFRTRPGVSYQRGMIQLRSGAPDQALQNLQEALRLEPGFMEAQVGVFQAYLAMREFELAEEALTKAQRMGLSDVDAALYRARIASTAADYTIRTRQAPIPGEEEEDLLSRHRVDSFVRMCRQVTGEVLDPALRDLDAFVEEGVLDDRDVARIRQAAGDMKMQKASVLSMAWRRLSAAREEAARVGNAEEAQERGRELGGFVEMMRDTQAQAIEMYTLAHEADPELVAPRLAKARHFLTQYVPSVSRAREALEPVLEMDPANRSAREMMAVVERMGGNIEKALEHALMIQEEHGEDFDALLSKVTILVEAERWDEALPLTTRLFQEDPDHTVAAFYHGRALLNEERDAEALVTLQRAMSRVRTPWAQGRHYLAEALLRTGRREQATRSYLQAIEDATASMPTDIQRAGRLRETRYNSLVALSGIYAESDPREALQRARQAQEIYPHRKDAYDFAISAARAASAEPTVAEDIMLIHAAGLLARRDVAGAMEHCEREIEAAEDPAHVWRVGLLRARLLERQGMYTQAVEAYESLRGSGDDKRPMYELAELRLRLGQESEARHVYRELLEADPRDARAIRGKAALLSRTDDTDELRRVLTRSARMLGGAEARRLLMRHYFNEGLHEEAVTLGQAVAAIEPRNPAAHTMLAEALWHAGELEEARAVYSSALQLDSEYAPAYRRGLLDLQVGKTREAIALNEGASEAFPDLLAPRSHLALAHHAAGSTDQAVSILEHAVRELDLGSADTRDTILWYLAAMRAGEGDFTDALRYNAAIGGTGFGPRGRRERLLEGLATQPEETRRDVSVAANLLVAFRRAGMGRVAAEYARTLKRALPEETLLDIWTATLQANEGQREEAVATLRGVIAQEPDFMFARILLAQTHAGGGDHQRATEVLQETLRHTSEDQKGTVHFLIGQFHEQEGLYEAAKAHYELAMEDANVSPLARNNLAWVMATQGGDLERALELAEQAVEEGGPRPELLDTLGWVHHLLGNHDMAIRCLEIAKQSLPHVPTVRYHLGMAYLQIGRLEEGKRELEEALTISRDFPEVEEAIQALDAML